MSTPFQLLPAPTALRWTDPAPSPIGPVWSPWPEPALSTLKRSNVWPAPIIHTVSWMPPSIVHLAPPDPAVDNMASWWRRLVTRVAGLFRRSR
ncbi:MAG: hypothetical protein HOJ85_13955 [Ilumatobacter sp.]|uniref:hypothetical protein n=1 Tax=Ilumatobacter sp. TaxID=1967498 RepID=UPI001D64F7CC|nr:hypothetical protein [Ilumatobacter sp.]MBT5275578.1 hypothetical protein [Ilumatobacter sp.]MBT5554856.1 hypothetical protein [Ilumatobacter sp.]MBT5866819.1 hypothetical protein [Ilumatobacter sp.]MBT7430680.1 hypothetical protein [Ilumatobacter sp.]